MNRPARRRLPWEKDPADREGNYRRPVAQDDKIRLTVKAAAAVAGFLFIMSSTRDRLDVGAEFAIGVGFPLFVAGLLDFVWTIRGRLEHVFIESRAMQLAAHAGLAAVGATMAIAGAVAKGT